jgi:hypothetical protein
MPHHAYQRVAAKSPMPGVFILDDRIAVKVAVEEILLVSASSDQQEWDGLIVYLPL